MFRTMFVCTVVALYVLILSPPLLLAAALTGKTDAFYATVLWCCRTAFWLAGVRIHIDGYENIPVGCPVVFMPNHQSNCDPPALAVSLPSALMMAKQEFFRIPLLGLGMRMHGFVPVDRKSRARAFAAIDQAVSLLKKGRSFLVFPEGTRSKDGRLQTFKKGVFVMAIRAGAPIVPVSISGGRKIMRKGSFVIHPGVIRITVHDAIPTSSYTVADRNQVMDLVRRAILSGLAPDEQPLAE